MRIAKIIIKGFQQFDNFHVDLTDPKTGKPLEKVCLIGPNGTGKSTLLSLIWRIFSPMEHRRMYDSAHPNDLADSQRSLGNSFVAMKIHAEAEMFFVCIHPRRGTWVIYNAKVEDSEEWSQFVDDPEQDRISENFCVQQYLPTCPMPNLVSGQDVVINMPADYSSLLPNNNLEPTLNDALELFQNFPIFHSVSIPQIKEFWKLLIYLVKKRESDYQEYLKNPENKKKTIEDAETEFRKNHPEILPIIGDLWNRILAKAALEFDVEGASVPIQLGDSLRAYVKSKNSGGQLDYNSLSSGIRNYIFKLGHIQALYFQRQIKRGILLVDEPENSLYPDFLYGLIDEYCSIIKNTQFFVATHSPMIAAQFEPWERIHLDFDDRGFVTATHGVSPIGDDPNDLLIKDFRVRSIYGRQGIEQFERFLELHRLIKKTSDEALKHQMIDEYLAIGNSYNFDPDEVS